MLNPYTKRVMANTNGKSIVQDQKYLYILGNNDVAMANKKNAPIAKPWKRADLVIR